VSLSVTAAFGTALSATSGEPDFKLVAVLRNFAATAEGASITASSTFDANYPAAGAGDGDATHINWGPASGADDGIGLKGWKSGSMATTTTFTTQGNFASSTGLYMGDSAGSEVSVYVAYGSAAYNQAFDGLTNAALAAQDGWSVVSSVNTPIGGVTSDRGRVSAGGLQRRRDHALRARRRHVTGRCTPCALRPATA